jgi:ParB family chromosome partitioning protein
MNVDITTVHPGENPRRYMDQTELTELTQSIKELGVIQPITVKVQTDGQYIIVAGHRRHKAAVAAGLTDIPIFILDDDKDSDTVALVENVIRADMSPAEECERVLLLLKKSKGDVTEVSLSTGWSEDKIRRRAALASCSPEVRTALVLRQIKLGIAELLASVPEAENQNKALEKIITMNLSVEQVRQYLFRLVQKLDSAIFDRSECSQCRFNTSLQSTLFSETVAEDAYCTNSNCYVQKTDAAITIVAESLKDSYPLIKVVRAGDEVGHTRLIINNSSKGVGQTQATHCQGCAHYGATVSGLPGTEGQIATGICFDLDCNAKMVAAHQAELVQAIMEQRRSPDPVSGNAAPSMHDTENDNGADGGAESANTPETEQKVSPQPISDRPAVALTSAVKEYRRTLWNRAAISGLGHNQDAAQSVLAAIIMKHKNALQGHEVAKVLSKYVETMGNTSMIDQTDVGTIAQAIQSEKHMDRKLLAAAAAYAVAQLDEADVRSILAFLGVDITEIWKIDGDYLTLLTKTEIISVADELGISEKVADWKKVSNGKKTELVQAIMVSGVDFNGLLPTTLRY